MNAWRGFTVIELMVVMVVMAILLTLGVAQFNGTQANARDAERRADIETISKGLESRYNNGNPFATATYITRGAYPSINEILHAENTTVASITPTSAATYIDQLLAGTSINNFFPPNTTVTPANAVNTFKVICAAAGTAPCNANNNAEDAAKISTALGAAPGVYVYEPITAANQICYNTECVRYNLYYNTESAGTTTTVASRHQ